MVFGRKARASAPEAAGRPVDLPRDEMAFRKVYQRLLLAQEITAVFRPGDRRFPAWRGYAPGEAVTARVIARVGSDALGVPPVFNEVRVPIRIHDVALLEAASLGPEDFAGCSPDVCDVAALTAHLEGIYQRPLAEYGGVVTRIRFHYLAPPSRRSLWRPA